MEVLTFREHAKLYLFCYCIMVHSIEERCYWVRSTLSAKSNLPVVSRQRTTAASRLESPTPANKGACFIYKHVQGHS